MKNKRKNNRGITLISLAVTIIVMTILTTCLTLSIKSTTQIDNYYGIKEDIIQLSESVQEFYAKNGELPIATETTAISFGIDSKYKNPNDDDGYYYIDISKFKDITINNSKVHYIVNKKSLTVYCQEGYVMDGKRRYTIVDGLEFYNKVNIPIISVVTFESNNAKDKYIAYPKDTVTLKMIKTEQLTTQPVVTINGQTVTATWDNNIGTASYKIPDDDKNFDQLISFSIVGYSAEGKNGEEITKPTFKDGITLKEPISTTTFPYYPPGDAKVPETNLKDGLVMEDSKGNQYVWVEVPKTEEVYPNVGLSITNFNATNCKSIERDLQHYAITYRSDSNYVTSYSDKVYNSFQTGLTEAQYLQLKNEMLKSVYQNGGFWIGRYEVGDKTSTINKTIRTNSTGTSNEAVIKEGQYPYDYVTCAEAETLAKSFNPDAQKYNTDLLFGIQWDLTLKHLENKGITLNILRYNSTSWGNYKNSEYEINKGQYNIVNSSSWYLNQWNQVSDIFKKSGLNFILLTTGATDKHSQKNIYDLAGNVWELTLEYSNDSSYPCAIRGGCLNESGEYYPADRRTENANDIRESLVGFRVSLYKK